MVVVSKTNITSRKFNVTLIRINANFTRNSIPN